MPTSTLLRECRDRLVTLTAALDGDLGPSIVSLVLGIDQFAAIEWIKSKGDPTYNPAASVLLINAAGFNAETIVATCTTEQVGKAYFNFAILAASMTRLLIEARLAFPNAPDSNLH